MRESDLIASILTSSKGKLSALAKGVRRSKKRFMGGLDIFDSAVFRLSELRGGGDLFLLEGIADREPWLALRGDLLKFSLGSLLLEIAGIFAPEGDPESRRLFDPLHSTLERLNSAGDSGAAVAEISYFLLRLLEMSGIGALESGQPFAADVESWLVTMTKGGLAEVPKSPETITRGFDALLRYIEAAVGARLRARTDVLNSLTRLRA